MMMNEATQHGAVGADISNFIRCLPLQPFQHTKADLALLALDMQSGPDTIDPGPDAEENMYVPAGFTYFGQFIDHDLTFDTTSTFDGQNAPTNQRTPRLDLDCVYGRGPIDSPDMYDSSGVFLVQGTVLDSDTGRKDLNRKADGTAIIGDPRNDENSIISQIQAAFVNFHNWAAQSLSETTGASGPSLFNAARREVTWTYQRILVEDYLPRIIASEVITDFEAERRPDTRQLTTNPAAFKIYVDANRAALPLEFAAAGYRFGHSMVRNGYFLQDNQSFPIFDGAMDAMSLVGFQPLPKEHVIKDWRRFFPDSRVEQTSAGNTFNPAPGTPAGNAGKNDAPADEPGKPRLQFAYRIDTSVANPLASLPAVVASDPPPSLIVRNLWRAAAFQLPTGQDFEHRLGIEKTTKHLAVRDQQANAATKSYKFRAIEDKFASETPLWFYILAEAQQPLLNKFGSNVFSEGDLKDHAAETGTQLGKVGGRLLLEVFHGLLDSDADSYRNHALAETWKPLVKKFRVWDVVSVPN
jgi:hypothetical protein